MTQEEQAQALARWLSGPPGSPPPTELDAEVVESMYALRPELAADPVVDLDEILDGLTAGPLAAPERRAAASSDAGGEVVPFPAVSRPQVASVTSSEAAPAGRGWVRWASLAVGGTSSLGLLIAAAAVLLFVALPAGQTLQMPTPAGAPQAEALSPAAASAPAPMPIAEPTEGGSAKPDAARQEDRRATEDVVAGGVPVAPMQSESKLRANTTIPELDAPVVAGVAGGAGGLQSDAVAEAELAEEAMDAPPAPPKATAAAPPAAEASSDALARRPAAKEDAAPEPRTAAVPKDLANNGWRRGLDKATQQLFDGALTEAEAQVRSGDLRGGADRLAAAVGAPPRAGQYVAGRSTSAFLAAGDPAAAVSVARRGLALSSENTPERSQLLLLLGDALQAAGDAAGAEQAWQQAATANAGR
jgi:hypothetical protein